ncbi:Swarming motility protein YbiA, partial [Escherichia coli]|nr:Swarming motility protein YbiA [Escherichia coli]
NDAYWGAGGNGQGKNRLGYLLMALRGQLAAEK